MCRIYGCFNAPASPHELRTVAALQRHGGPDGHGVTHQTRHAVGSNRLAVMDPGGGAQPYRLADGAVTVVFNGEIYNHDELRRDLRAHGFTFPDRCDGTVLPALYRRYGDAFTERLDGMYAIAVLDLRATPRLVLATDPMGMKPLFYHWDPVTGALYFSSEIPSLLAFAPVSTRTWAPGLDAYLSTKTPFGGRTMFADVHVLPPGSVAVCDPVDGLRVRHRPPPAVAADATDLAETARTLRDTLRAEVHRLLVADVPVACVTSGGLDSSLVTALAAQALSAPDRDAATPGAVHAFNVAYTGSWPADERRYARQVADRAAAVYHQVEVDPVTFPDLLADVVWHLGQPNADPITLSTYALFAAVRAAGFPVAVSGDAADEVFGGYERFRAAADADAAGRPWYPDYLDALAVLPAADRRRLYTADYAAELDRAEPPVPAEATDALRHGDGTVLQRITAFELRYRLPAYHLRRVDHLSMAHAVEVRLPFCQRAVVDVGLSLPDRLRMRDGRAKPALYAAADGLLPHDVLARDKQPFTLPVAAMLAPGWPLWDYARDMLGTHRLRDGGQVDPDRVRDLFARQAERPDGTTALTLWALLVYEVWREQFATGSLRRLDDARAVPA